jgi:hypothetical protein
MLQEAKAEIDLLGPNNALQGKGTEDQSGRAIIAQQQAGLAELAPLYDRFNDFKLRVYRATWARIKQFWKAPKWIRITDDQQATQFIGLNQVQGIDPMTMQPQVSNPVAQMDVDVILETGPDTITLQSEEFEQLAQIMPQLAALPPPYALALIEASSLPAQRKKKMTELLQGGGEQSPEAQAMAQKQAEMAERAAMAEISTKESSAALNMAKAQNENALAQSNIQLERERMMADQAKAQGDVAIKAQELQIKQQELQFKLAELELKRAELGLKQQELAVNVEMERERSALTERMADRQAMAEDNRAQREASRPQETEKPDKSGEAVGMGLQALAAALSKPKSIVRGADGKPIGIE